MNTTMLTRVRKHFVHDMVPREIARANQRKWVRAVRMLGSNWLLHPSNATQRKTS
jgi:hypothetical protein